MLFVQHPIITQFQIYLQEQQYIGATPSANVTINSPNSPQTTITKNTDGQISLTATVTSCGTPTTITKQPISVGAPYYIPTGTYTKDGGTNPYYLYTNPAYYGTVVYYNNICAQARTTLNVPASYSVVWSFVSASTSGYVYWYQVGNDLYVMPNYNQSVIFQAQYTNSCGSGYAGYVGFTSGYCSGGGYYYRMSPNPAGSTVTVSEKEPEAGKAKANKTITELNIYDQVGNIQIRKQFSKVKTGTINVSDLKPGVYFIEIVDGTNKERQQLIIQR